MTPEYVGRNLRDSGNAANHMIQLAKAAMYKVLAQDRIPRACTTDGAWRADVLHTATDGCRRRAMAAALCDSARPWRISHRPATSRQPEHSSSTADSWQRMMSTELKMSYYVGWQSIINGRCYRTHELSLIGLEFFAEYLCCPFKSLPSQPGLR